MRNGKNSTEMAGYAQGQFHVWCGLCRFHGLETGRRP